MVSDFNDCVMQYNQRMRELTMASTSVDFGLATSWWNVGDLAQNVV